LSRPQLNGTVDRRGKGGLTMTEPSALAVAQQAWERWVAVDLEGFLALWDADGVWTMPGNSQIAGTWRGHDEIAKVAQTAFEVSGGTLKSHPIELAAAGDDSVLGYFHVEASRADASLDQDGLQRFVVRDGKIVSLHNLFADLAAADAFFQ
jgi:ketosteroid isomerase-like protein